LSKSVLHINSAEEAEIVFYEAFTRGDADVMSALWAEGDVVCVHPGSGIISGHNAVERSWRHILENFQGGDVRYTAIKKSQTDDFAVHVVTEELLSNGVVIAVVIATNVYQRFSQSWLMVEHHASIVQQKREGETLQ
jgi:ketosteroid isomerase-like protein